MNDLVFVQVVHRLAYMIEYMASGFFCKGLEITHIQLCFQVAHLHILHDDVVLALVNETLRVVHDLIGSSTFAEEFNFLLELCEFSGADFQTEFDVCRSMLNEPNLAMSGLSELSHHLVLFELALVSLLCEEEPQCVFLLPSRLEVKAQSSLIREINL